MGVYIYIYMRVFFLTFAVARRNFAMVTCDICKARMDIRSPKHTQEQIAVQESEY